MVNDTFKILGGTVGVLLAVILFLAAILVGPWLTIQAIEALWRIQIPFNFWTWLSVVWLAMVFGGVSYRRG